MNKYEKLKSRFRIEPFYIYSFICFKLDISVLATIE